MKSHGLEPNNGARHRIDRVNRRKATSIFNGIVYAPQVCDLLTSILSANLKNRDITKVLHQARGEQVEWS